MVKEPISTRRTLMVVKIHQLRVRSPFQVSYRYIIASVILEGQVMPGDQLWNTHMQRKEPSRAPITESKSSKIGMDSAMMKDIKVFTATHELMVRTIHIASDFDLQPNDVVDRSVPSQVTSTA
jgi:hypothetical protein